MKYKLMNYPAETEHEAMGQRQRTEFPASRGVRITERQSLGVFLHSTCKHALRKGSTIKRPVYDLELFDDQRRKSARII